MNKKTDLTITSWNVDEFNRCPKQFWVSANNPSDLPGIQASALRAIEAANEVRDRGQQFMIKDDDYIATVLGNCTASHELTHTHLDNGEVSLIHGATFFVNGVLAKVDGIRKLSEVSGSNFCQGLEIIMVTSSTKYKPSTHLKKAAFLQYAITINPFMRVERVTLLHVNSDYVAGGNEPQFIEVDLTHEIGLGDVESVRTSVEEMRLTVSDAEPVVRIGAQCSANGHDCPLMAICWKDVSEPTIYDIPRLSGGVSKLSKVLARFTLKIPRLEC